MELIRFTFTISVDELLKGAYSAMTTVEHYKLLAHRLEDRDTLPRLLVYGHMVLVRSALTEFHRYSDHHIKNDLIFEAINLALDKDEHDRAVGLMKAAQERHAEEEGQGGHVTEFEIFMDDYFEKFSPEVNSRPLKRFLTHHGEKFNKEHPAIYENFCLSIVRRLKNRRECNSSAEKMLADLVGQPSILTPTAFARGCLNRANITSDRFLMVECITHAWREAIVEGIKGEYRYGYVALWYYMAKQFPGQLSENYPPSDKELAAALAKFPTKQEREMAWVKENAPHFQGEAQVKFLAEVLNGFDLHFPTVLWVIVAGYAVVPTWLDLEEIITPEPTPSRDLFDDCWAWIN